MEEGDVVQNIDMLQEEVLNSPTKFENDLR